MEFELDRRVFIQGLSGGVAANAAATPPTSTDFSRGQLAAIVEERLDTAEWIVSAMLTRVAQAIPRVSGVFVQDGGQGKMSALDRDSCQRRLVWTPADSHAAFAPHSLIIATCRSAAMAIRGGDASFRWTSGCRFGGASVHIFRRGRSTLVALCGHGSAGALGMRVSLVA